MLSGGGTEKSICIIRQIGLGNFAEPDRFVASAKSNHQLCWWNKSLQAVDLQS